MLSKQTIERIEQDAKVYGLNECPESEYPHREFRELFASTHSADYKAGATAEATRHEAERKELETQLDEMTKEKDYWFNRTYHAERFISESPCDPDITQEQIEAHTLWVESKENRV